MNASFKPFVSASLCLACFALVSCRDEGRDEPGGTSPQGSGRAPSLDVRGGETDSETRAGSHTSREGVGGAGGSIRLTTSAGNITISAATLATAPQATNVVGTRIDVGPGQRQRLAGALVLDSFRVQAGGLVQLVGNTFLTVLGDVQIDGAIIGKGSDRSPNGYDLTIDADGIINITGTVDCSGKEGEDRFSVSEPNSVGGNGGEIFISGSLNSGGSAGPHFFISGAVISNGGDTFTTDLFEALPGSGGQILLGTAGSFSIGGSVRARGGFSINQGLNSGAEADGGQIQLIAAEGIEMGGVRELTANGGDSTGSNAGAAGSLLLEAPVGAIQLDDFGIECNGGSCLFRPTGTAGAGGTVTLSASSVDVDNVAIDIGGGDSDGDRDLAATSNGADVGGQGGAGGSVQIAAVTAIDFASNTSIDARGGRSRNQATPGGTGGSVTVVNLDETNLGVVNFRGVVSVLGGLNEFGFRGADGTICARGADLASSIILTGTNNFPISICGESSIADLIIHDLDCDEATINPASVKTELPAISGVDFYRVYVDPATTDISISTTGEDGGNINLYVGTSAVIGSTNPGDYDFSSTGPDSSEQIDIDLTIYVPGTFLSVWIDEASAFVEEYSLDISCTP